MATNDEVVMYEYRGISSELPTSIVPQNVTHVRFHPSVTLVTDIGNRAFTGRDRLREVLLNEGLKIIGVNAFKGCKLLQSIMIPSTVEEIGESAFEDCYNLREVVFHEGITKIKKNAFKCCSSLVSVTIPSTVIKIGDGAFKDCTNLREVALNMELMAIVPPSPDITTLGPWICRRCAFENLRNLTNMSRCEMCNSPRQKERHVFGGCLSLLEFKFPCISTRLKNVIQAGQTEAEIKINEMRELVEWRDGELSISAVILIFEEDASWITVKRRIDQVVKLITYYEIKDATTQFELAMWKYNIDQADISNPTERAAYRLEVPGPIKDTILQFLL